MNSCNFVGRLTSDPELRRTSEGTAVCSYSLAVKRPGVPDKTDFIEFVSWRQSAEYLSQYGHKGDVVAVSGTLQPRMWKDKEGNNRKTMEIVTTNVELSSSKRNAESEGNTQNKQTRSASQSSYQQNQFDPINDPDIQLPF